MERLGQLRAEIQSLTIQLKNLQGRASGLQGYVELLRTMGAAKAFLESLESDVKLWEMECVSPVCGDRLARCRDTQEIYLKQQTWDDYDRLHKRMESAEADLRDKLPGIRESLRRSLMAFREHCAAAFAQQCSQGQALEGQPTDQPTNRPTDSAREGLCARLQGLRECAALLHQPHLLRPADALMADWGDFLASTHELQAVREEWRGLKEQLWEQPLATVQFDAVRARLVPLVSRAKRMAFLHRYPHQWSPDTHELFTWSTREGIRTFLLIHQRAHALPEDLLFVLLPYLPASVAGVPTWTGMWSKDAELLLKDLTRCICDLPFYTLLAHACNVLSVRAWDAILSVVSPYATNLVHPTLNDLARNHVLDPINREYFRQQLPLLPNNRS